MSRIYGASRQLGIVVRDIDEGMKEASALLGVGPFHIFREVRPDWFKYRGADSQPPLMSLAFAFSGPLQLEIIQQHDDAPSAYKDFLDRGQSGAQHLSSWADSHENYDAMRAQAIEMGSPIVHEGQLGPGRFTYFDTVGPTLGLCFEISEYLLPEYAEADALLVSTSANWDGSDPVRSF